MDLSMRLDLPTPASPSTSTFKLTRLSKIFSRGMFVIGWRRHSPIVQAKHPNLDQFLVTEETTDPLLAWSARSSPPALGAELHTGGAGCTNTVAIGTDDQRLPIYFFIGYCWWWWCCCFFTVLYRNRLSEASYVFVLIGYCCCWWWWWWWWSCCCWLLP